MGSQRFVDQIFAHGGSAFDLLRVHREFADLRLLLDVRFRELHMQDLCVCVAVPVIEDVDVAIRCLEAIGIRNVSAIINEEAFAPGLAIVV